MKSSSAQLKIVFYKRKFSVILYLKCKSKSTLPLTRVWQEAAIIRVENKMFVAVFIIVDMNKNLLMIE